jgi:glycosyltransferase involved in cell wall biosynthesis
MSEIITSGGSLKQPDCATYQGVSTTWPRIALVTPVYNSARYLEQTIESVLEQRYPNLDYFIVDGGSTDGSTEIIKKYESRLSGWLSEPDNGMYDALNKGFARTSGEIMGWVSATDKLHPGGMTVVGSVFRDLPQVEWITGRRTAFSEEGETKRIDDVLVWSRWRFLMGASRRHIQQESTYWRRSLWERAGGYVDASRRSASDFELWLRFFRHERLYAVDALIGGFREHADSDSLADLGKFNALCDQLAEKELGEQWGKAYSAYKRIDAVVRRVPKVRALWYRAKFEALNAMYGMRGPIIRRMNGKWTTAMAYAWSSSAIT